jgi:hypothetical protein
VTYAEVDDMARGKLRFEWMQTASQICHAILPHVEKHAQRQMKIEQFMPKGLLVDGGNANRGTLASHLRAEVKGAKNVERIPLASVRVV